MGVSGPKPSPGAGAVERDRLNRWGEDLMGKAPGLHYLELRTWCLEHWSDMRRDGGRARAQADLLIAGAWLAANRMPIPDLPRLALPAVAPIVPSPLERTRRRLEALRQFALGVGLVGLALAMAGPLVMVGHILGRQQAVRQYRACLAARAECPAWAQRGQP